MNRAYLALALTLGVSTSGCFLGDQAKVKVPSGPGAAPAASPSAQPSATEPTPTPAPQESGAAAGIAPAAEAAPAASTTPPASITPPVAPTPPPKPPVARTNPALPPATASPPVPLLAEILTPEQRRQYQTEYTQDVARANSALKQAAAHNLTAAQRETATRIKTFLTQAEAARYNDIATALQLSRRADLLGQELLKGLK